MQITKKRQDTLDQIQSEHITKSFIKKMVAMLQAKDYISKNDIQLSADISGTSYYYDDFNEFDNNVSPEDRFENISIFINHAFKYEIDIYFGEYYVCFELGSSTLSDKQADCIIADIREDFYYLLDCSVTGKEYEQTKQYGYSIRKKTYDQRKRKSLVWYKSGFFWTVAGVILALVGIAITIVFQIMK